MAGGQQLDVLQQRAVGKNILKGEIFKQGRFIQLAFKLWVSKNCFLFGSEHQPVTLDGHVKRLDTIAVSGQQQSAFLAIPKSKGKHAVKTQERIIAPVCKRGQNDLGVRF